MRKIESSENNNLSCEHCPCVIYAAFETGLLIFLNTSIGKRMCKSLFLLAFLLPPNPDTSFVFRELLMKHSTDREIGLSNTIISCYGDELPGNLISGGKKGIRTLGGFQLNGFQGRLIRPLGHLTSICSVQQKV